MTYGEIGWHINNASALPGTQHKPFGILDSLPSSLQQEPRNEVRLPKEAPNSRMDPTCLAAKDDRDLAASVFAGLIERGLDASSGRHVVHGGLQGGEAGPVAGQGHGHAAKRR